MDDAATQTRVEWREWGADAFAEAEESEQPVLLSLSATWCAWCHKMDARTYSEPRIAAHVNDSFVPVRVDVDRHPRVRDRYNMGGFPSTVFLAPDGRILTGAGFLGPDGMRQVIESVRGLWNRKGAEAGRLPRALRDEQPPGGDLSPSIESRLVERVRTGYDDEHAGWSESEKFPLSLTIEFALSRARNEALGTLDAVRDALFDDYEGGFFRFAEDRNWRSVHEEKVLDANAGLVRAFTAAYRVTGDDRYLEPADRTIGYLTSTLWNGEAFAASQAPGDGYYALDPSEREEESPPPVDESTFADWNALAVDALFAYDAAVGDEHARRYATRELEYHLDALVDEDGSVVHYRNGDETGERDVLSDQARTLQALVRAEQVRAESVLDVARSVADRAVDRLRDERALRDGPASGPGMLDRPLYPLDANVEFADAALTLSVLTGEERYREVAESVAAAFAGASDRFGPQVAAYGGLVSRLLDGPEWVGVGAPAGSELHRASLRNASHGTVVVPAAGDVDDRVNAGEVTRFVDGAVAGRAASVGDVGELFPESDR